MHRSKPYAMLPQRIQRTLHKKNPVQCCLIKNPMQCCPRGSRQHCIIKNPVQCCLNTLGTILHRTKSYAIFLRGSRQHCIIKKILFNAVLILLGQYCTGQNPMQCCPRVSRHIKFPCVLIFGIGISKGCNTIMQSFQGFQGYNVTNLEIF